MEVVYEGVGKFRDSQARPFFDINIEFFFKEVEGIKLGPGSTGSFLYTAELEIDNGEEVLLDTVIAGAARTVESETGALVSVVTMAGQGLEIEGVFDNWQGPSGPDAFTFRLGGAKHFSGNLRLINASGNLSVGVAVFDANFAAVEN